MDNERNPIRVLLVKDSPIMLWGLGRLIGSEAPRMALAGSAQDARSALRHALLRPAVIVIDLELDGASCIELIPTLKERSHGRVLIHTGIGDRRLHEDAVLFGASGVVPSDAPGATVLDAIAAVHAGRRVNIDPATIARPRSDAEIAASAAPGLAFLSPSERRTIALLRTRSHPTTPSLHEVAAIYSKLGLHNRRELERFAARIDRPR